VAACALPVAAWAQGTPPASAPAASGKSSADPGPIADPNVVPAGCATCGNGLLGGPHHGGGLFDGGCADGSCGGGGQCVPGRNTCFCSDWVPDSACGRFLNGLYQCICCPDPCYEPHWFPVADSAFFVDAARPVTQMRLRYEHDWNIRNPDRGEFFWAAPNFAAGKTNPGPVQLIGPAGPCARSGFGKGQGCAPDSVDADELFLYSEAGTGRFSAFVEMSYESLDPTDSPAFIENGFGACCHRSGFGDMNVGTKAMLLDCQLVQLSFQFKTFIPTGAFTKGLGTGHVSLEPSFLLGLCLTHDCYLQAQFSYWIPIGGDDLYMSDVFHNHLSINHVLCRPCTGVEVVGTLEFNDWWFLSGAYTQTAFLIRDANGVPSPVLGTGGGSNIFSAGPGIRVFICDKIDFGVGSAINFGGDRLAEDVVRAEFRWRF
jgi:hypothetical protein